MIVYVVQTVPPERSEVEVFTSLDHAKATMEFTWQRLGTVHFQENRRRGFSEYRCDLYAEGVRRLVGTILQREVQEAPTHL